jgi:hypothetical protein
MVIDQGAWNDETSPNLQDDRLADWLDQSGASLLVQSVDADEYGGASILFPEGHALRVFPAGSTGEDWRLFRPGTEQSHFVVSGGKVKS